MNWKSPLSTPPVRSLPFSISHDFLWVYKHVWARTSFKKNKLGSLANDLTNCSRMFSVHLIFPRTHQAYSNLRSFCVWHSQIFHEPSLPFPPNTISSYSPSVAIPSNTEPLGISVPSPASSVLHTPSLPGITWYLPMLLVICSPRTILAAWGQGLCLFHLTLYSQGTEKSLEPTGLLKEYQKLLLWA